MAGRLLFLPLPPKKVFWKSLFFVLLFLALALFLGRLAYYRMFHMYASAMQLRMPHIALACKNAGFLVLGLG